MREAGAGYRLVGVVTGVFAVAGAIGGPLLGRLVDRTGQPRVLSAPLDMRFVCRGPGGG